MPAFNAGPFLAAAIQSVRQQSFGNWLLHIVDNGSTDETHAIIDRFRYEDARISFVHEPVRGAWAARNTGLKLARSEFVAFLDADDCFADAFSLEAMYDAAKSYNVLIAGGSKRLIHSNGRESNSFEERNRGLVFERTAVMEYKSYQFDYGFYRFIYNREMLMRSDVKFPAYQRFEDPPFMVRAMLAARSFVALDRATYKYRLGHQSITWREKEVCGLLEGIRENLYLSRQHQLHQLHRLTVERLTTEYADTIQNSYGGAGDGIRRIESACLAAIDVSRLLSTQKDALLAFYRNRRSQLAPAPRTERSEIGE